MALSIFGSRRSRSTLVCFLGLQVMSPTWRIHPCWLPWTIVAGGSGRARWSELGKMDEKEEWLVAIERSWRLVQPIEGCISYLMNTEGHRGRRQLQLQLASLDLCMLDDKMTGSAIYQRRSPAGPGKVSGSMPVGGI